jgi:serine/threonine protein kinase/uncharacterized protein YegL
VDDDAAANEDTPSGSSDAPPRIPGYELGELIGEGGFSTVYAARDEAFRRTVAVKVLHVRLDEGTRRYFDGERHALGAVSGHPNIVDVYSSGVDADSRAYFVMEYMPGGSVAGRSRPWDEVVLMGVKLAGALESAHRVGVLHRDVKPENVLLSGYGEPKLADFGIARIEGDDVGPGSGFVTASPLHAAPEVLDKLPTTVASEVYSLGSTLYAMLAGRAAFQHDADDHPLALLYRVATEPVPDLRPHGIPGPVCDVLERAMAKDPDARPRSARALGVELQVAQRDLGVVPTAMHVVLGGETTVIDPQSGPVAPSAPGAGSTPKPAPERPGAQLASRPLHFIWIADCSESMILDGKIDALNEAIRSSIPRMREVAAQNPHARVLVRCLAFSTGVHWTIQEPVPVDDLSWVDLRASGYTDMGAALRTVAEEMRVPPMEARALPPVLVLVSDGQPTDDFDAGVSALLSEPWGRKAVRIAIAIGSDADLEVLTRFMDNPELRPLVAANARQLADLARWVSTAATRAATAVPATVPVNLQLPPPPAHRRDGITPTW